jgi:peptidoglycan/LPS O-acetylase OafA/YrhL
MASMRRAVPREQISQVPYLPGIDGLRALAVAAVVVYHGNNSWLHGGFLGVEVFLVISGYLITLLLIAEHERSGLVDLKNFWLRRARRLLPALFLLLLGLAVYTSLFYNRARASTRGDFIAALAYVSNWFQVWVGAGYTAGEAFAPLRHLWSLAVEEQFYLIWPLVMVAILRLGRRRLPQVAGWLVVLSLLITVVVALVYRSGDVAIQCTQDMNGYAKVGGRCISVNDGLYLGTFSRAGGLLLGSAFAMLWRPNAIIRGPLRDRAAMLDGLAAAGALILALLMWRLKIVDSGEDFGVRYDPWLFRGGFFVTGIATLMIIAAVTHRESISGRVLATPVLNWVGTRSYGLYLYHWPVYQAIRKQAGVSLSVGEFVLAMVITLPITELSYRYVETPIRKGQLGVVWDRVRSRGMWQRPVQVAVAAVVFMVAAAVASIAFAPRQCVTSLECQLEAAPDPTAATTSTPTTVAPTVVTAPGQTTTLPPTTPAPTTLPVELRPPVAFGESVMLSALRSLSDAGITVKAAEAIQASDILEMIGNAKAANELGNIVIVQVGTNGTVTQAELDAIMTQLAQTPLAIFLTVHADRSWIAGNNELIRALPAKYPNVKIVDWDEMVTTDPSILASDQIHVDDRRKYAAAIVAAYQGT